MSGFIDRLKAAAELDGQAPAPGSVPGET